MAVLKSTAYGQVRKSVGANNYYRRAGVQIVRSKPTFAPGRQFTPAQLSQQYRMQVTQYILLQVGLGQCAKCANVVNNRLYNASSRYNRMVKQVIMNDWEYTEAEFPTPAEMWDYGWESVLEKWSIGDVKGAPTRIEIVKYNNEWTLHVYGLDEIAAQALYLVNKKRAKSGQLSYMNIGVCGVIFGRGTSRNGSYIVLPTLSWSGSAPGKDYYSFNFAASIPDDQLDDLWYNFVFFVADGEYSGLAKAEMVALHCTNSTGWNLLHYITQASGDDRPVIE